MKKQQEEAFETALRLWTQLAAEEFEPLHPEKEEGFT